MKRKRKLKYRYTTYVEPSVIVDIDGRKIEIPKCKIKSINESKYKITIELK